MPRALMGFYSFMVLTSIGVAIIATALLRDVSSRILVPVALGILLLHPLLDASWLPIPLRAMLYEPVRTGAFRSLYPIVPWIAILLLGFVVGRDALTRERPAKFWAALAALRDDAQAGAEVLVSALSRQMAAEEATHQTPAPATALTDVRQLLPGLGEPVAIAVQENYHAVGRTLAALDLRSRTGAVVLAITRGGAPILLPTGHETIQAGDRLAVAGTKKAVRAAAELLRSGRSVAD